MSTPSVQQQALGAQRTLVLNADWTPLEVWDWREAVCALVRGAASVAASYDGTPVRSPTCSFALPSVLVRRRYVRTDRPAALTRRNVFLAYAELRPTGLAWRCALCGAAARRHELTFDHVVPRCRGGGSEWNNLALACAPCNGRKGSRTLAEAGMRLLVPPRAPTEREVNQARLHADLLDPPAEWRDFLSEAYWEAVLER